MRTCYSCHESKPLEEFVKSARHSQGYKYQCRKCKTNENKKRRQANPQVVAGYARKHMEAKRDRIRQLKEATACMDCGMHYPFYVMQYDHRPGTVKLFELSEFYRYGWDKIAAEIEKCDLLCGNCHAIRTHQRLHSSEDSDTVEI